MPGAWLPSAACATPPFSAAFPLWPRFNTLIDAVASLVNWDEARRQILAFVHKRMGALVVVALSGAFWAVWSWIEDLPGPVIGLAAFGALALATAAVHYVRLLWPKRPLSLREERQKRIEKKLAAVKHLADLASDFGGCARRPRAEESHFLKMHGDAMRFISAALATEGLEDLVKCFSSLALPDHGGTVQDRFREGERWLGELVTRVVGNRYYINDEWDDR